MTLCDDEIWDLLMGMISAQSGHMYTSTPAYMCMYFHVSIWIEWSHSVGFAKCRKCPNSPWCFREWLLTSCKPFVTIPCMLYYKRSWNSGVLFTCQPGEQEQMFLLSYLELIFLHYVFLELFFKSSKQVSVPL